MHKSPPGNCQATWLSSQANEASTPSLLTSCTQSRPTATSNPLAPPPHHLTCKTPTDVHFASQANQASIPSLLTSCTQSRPTASSTTHTPLKHHPKFQNTRSCSLCTMILRRLGKFTSWQLLGHSNKVGKVDLVVITGQSSNHSQLAHFMHSITFDRIFNSTCSAAASPQLDKHLRVSTLNHNPQTSCRVHVLAIARPLGKK